MDWLGLAAGWVQLHGSSDMPSCHTSQPLLGWLFCHPLLTLVTGELLRVAVTQLRQLVTRELLLAVNLAPPRAGPLRGQITVKSPGLSERPLRDAQAWRAGRYDQPLAMRRRPMLMCS